MTQSPASIVTREDVTVTFCGKYKQTGMLVHHRPRYYLELTTDKGTERLSVNLAEQGLLPQGPNNVFIRDYSETRGVAQSLAKAGVARIIRQVPIGNFDNYGYEVEILTELQNNS